MNSSDLLALRFATKLQPSTVWLLLALLLTWSFGLRLWYATPKLDSTRFWDERYGLENLEPLLKEGQLRPVHGFHPGFSYLPHGLALKASDLLYRATGHGRLAIFDPRGSYTPTAYLICRTLSAVFGTLSLLFLFLIGQRLGGARLGLLGAFLLSIVPWHLRQSVLFKADITLLFTIVLTVYLSLRAVERPTIRRFAVAGVGIGLALSSKFNAGPVAIPLAIGALLRPGRKRRACQLLGLAAVVSIAVFLLLQPYILIDPEIYRRSMGSTTRVYEKVARREDYSRLYLFRHLIESLLDPAFHGPVLGALAVVGLGAVAVLAMRWRRRSEVALPWLMLLSYVVAYPILYALATPRPSPHNWLPISPFAALGAAWILLAGWLWLAARLPGRRASRVVRAATGVLVVALGWQACSYVYRETVPRTGDRALELLRTQLRDPPGRIVYSGHDFQIQFQNRFDQGRLAIRTLDRLDVLSPAALDHADAEVFPTALLADSRRGDFYRQRLAGAPRNQVLVIDSRPFRAWGPALTIVLHPWRSRGQWSAQWVRSAGDPEVFFADLGDELAGERRLSVEFWVPRRMVPETLEVGGQPVELIAFRGPRRQTPVTTTRFEYRPRIRLQMALSTRRDRFPLLIRSWAAPRSVRPDGPEN